MEGVLGWGHGPNPRSADGLRGAVNPPNGAQSSLTCSGRGEESIVFKRMLRSVKNSRKLAFS